MKRLPCMELLKEPECMGPARSALLKRKPPLLGSTLTGAQRWRVTFESQGGFLRWLWGGWLAIEKENKLQMKLRGGSHLFCNLVLSHDYPADFERSSKHATGSMGLEVTQTLVEEAIVGLLGWHPHNRNSCTSGPSIVAGKIWCSGCLGPMSHSLWLEKRVKSLRAHRWDGILEGAFFLEPSFVIYVLPSLLLLLSLLVMPRSMESPKTNKEMESSM